MKFFGIDFKYNGFDVWHKGNQGSGSGMDADKLDGKHASEFQQLSNGGAYGLFPSTASTMVGNEYNVLLNAHKRSGVTISQSGTGLISTTDSLFDGVLSPNYSSDGINPSNPYVLLITGLPNIHTQTGGVLGWTSRYWFPSKYKIEAYDSYNNVGWKTILDRSTVDTPTKELLIPIYPSYSGSLTQLRITIYESSGGSIGANGYKRWGLSEIFFIHPEAMRIHQYLQVGSADKLETARNINGVAFDGTANITITANPNAHPHTKSDITDFPTLATVATSGNYNDLSNKPSIPTTLPANGGNADTVDNKHASDFAPSGYGLGGLCKSVTGDWNSYTDTGFYMGSALTNSPPATNGSNSWWYVLIMTHNTSPGWTLQLATDFNNKATYRRSKVNGTWSSWTLLYTTDNKPSPSDIGAAPASHSHTKSQITDMPTKLSDFTNDIGAGGGIKITTSATAPSSPSPSDFWYKEI